MSFLALALGIYPASAKEMGKTMDSMTLDQLRSEFNKSEGKTRIITLLSPT